MKLASLGSNRRFSVLIFLLVLCLVPSVPWAAMFTVNSTVDATDATPGNGVCETATGNGVCTLRAAIQESNALTGADTINLPAGTYIITISPASISGSTGSFLVIDHLSINGATAATTIVDGGGIDRVFTIVGYLRTVNMSNLTIQNGSVPAGTIGAGIAAWDNNNLNLTEVVVQNNQGYEGGGISNQGNLTLIRTVVRNNTATRISATTPSSTLGGGIYQSSGVLTIRDSTISNNTASMGGGLFNMGTTTIESSTISGNVATNGSPGTPMVNSGDAGGGIVNGSGSPGTLTITNSTISGNQANGNYGGIQNENGTLTLNNVTITNNIAGFGSNTLGNGGGLGTGFSSMVTVYMRNTILAGNTANGGLSADCVNANAYKIVSHGNNLIGNNTQCTFTPGTGDLLGTSANPVDPQLDTLADNGGLTFTHALLAGSPAIDTGNPSGCSTGFSVLLSDQRGISRAVNGGSGTARCDIGAYEFNSVIAVSGPDQTVSAQTVVQLDGSKSTSPAGIASYAWSQTSGAAVILSGTSTASPSFTAPATSGTLTFKLTVTDANGKTHSDSVVVTVQAPASSTSSGGGGGGGGGCSIQSNADFDPGMLAILFLSTILLWRRKRQHQARLI